MFLFECSGQYFVSAAHLFARAMTSEQADEVKAYLHKVVVAVTDLLVKQEGVEATSTDDPAGCPTDANIQALELLREGLPTCQTSLLVPTTLSFLPR